MRIDVLTLFPQMVLAPLSDSIVQRAQTTGALDLRAHDIRSWTDDVHRTVDDSPYGGGPGMVMKLDPIIRGVEALSAEAGPPDRILIMSASGKTFNQQMAVDLANLKHVAIICGHYEGIDARATEILAAQEVSIGDFVLTGGELAAAVIIDSIARLLPGVINAESIAHESHSHGLLEHPHYTRPADYRGHRVPEILLSGNHAAIAKWRESQAFEKTARIRPDLLETKNSS